MQVDYYPGCTIKASAGQYELSALAVLGALGIQAREMPSWNCCGVVHNLADDALIRHVAPVRVLARLEQQGGSELITFCDMCYNTLARANQLVREQPERRLAISEFMGAEQSYAGQVDVLHLLQILRDRIGIKAIRQRVRRKLGGLNVFPYYGCKLLRPSTVGIDNAEAPTVLRDLMQALGASVVDDPIQTQCCGSYHVVNRDAIVGERVATIAERARLKGADAIVLSCPLCQFNLDNRQPVGEPLPVFYFTQLIGLAFGLEPEALGLDRHCIDPLPLLVQHHLLDKEGAPA